MDTVFSIDEMLEEVAAEAKSVLAQRAVEIRAAQMQREQEEAARRQRDWEPYMTSLRRVVPEWAQGYIIEPDYELCQRNDGNHEYAPIYIEIPGCTQIAAWFHHVTRFEAAKPYLWSDEDGIWYVTTRVANDHLTVWGMEGGESSFAVAVMQAREYLAKEAELEKRAKMRNAEPNAPASVDEAPASRLASLAGIDPAAKVMEAIAKTDDFGAAGMLWAGLMIACELRAIREAAEDIAASLLAGELAGKFADTEDTDDNV